MLLVLMPGVTHRAMDVADMQLIRTAQNSVGKCGAARKDDVISTQIKLFSCHWHERKVKTMMRRCKRQIINETCMYFAVCYWASAKLLGVVNQGVNRRLGVEVCNLF